MDNDGERQIVKKGTDADVLYGNPQSIFPRSVGRRRKRNSGVMKHNERTRSAIPMKQRQTECMYATTMIWFRPTNSDIPRDSTDHDEDEASEA